MRPAFQMGDALPEVHRTAADDTMNIIAFLQQEFRQVRAILPRHTGNQRRLPSGLSIFCQVYAKQDLDTPETFRSDAHFSRHPTGHSRLILSQQGGQLPLRNPLPGHCSLYLTDNFKIYHTTKLHIPRDLTKLFTT